MVQLPAPIVPAEWWDDRWGTCGHRRLAVDSIICPFAQDIVPSDETRTKLRRHVLHWRSVQTAVTLTLALNAVTELPPLSIHNPLFLSPSNLYILSPVYGIHATQPISSNHLITPYLSRTTPLYLADLLNWYAQLGMPKPFKFRPSHGAAVGCCIGCEAGWERRTI